MTDIAREHAQSIAILAISVLQDEKFDDVDGLECLREVKRAERLGKLT